MYSLVSFDVCERWRDRRDTYRPAGEPINTSHYEMARLDDDKASKAFVVKHHYSGTYPAARFRFGLYRSTTHPLYDSEDTLVGVAVFSVPMRNEVLTNVFGGNAEESVELGRFVLLDNVEANGESWFLGYCRKYLKKIGLRGVVSFCDPEPKRDADGLMVFPGHIGTIYQASNAAFLGCSTARVLRLLPDGRVFSDRARSKIRKRRNGWRYAVAQLEAAGAVKTSDPDDEWLKEAIAQVTRPLRHSGNLRYGFVLNGKPLVGLPYPKRRIDGEDGEDN